MLKLIIAAALAAAAVPASAQPAGKTSLSGEAATGRKLFLAKCSACHAKDGKGSPKMAKLFKADPEILDLTGPKTAKLSPEEIKKVVSDGRKKMPSFKSKLKPAQLDDVVAYVVSLSRPAK